MAWVEIAGGDFGAGADDPAETIAIAAIANVEVIIVALRRSVAFALTEW